MSEEAIKWCLETSIGFIFSLFERHNKRVTRDELNRKFQEETAKFKVSNRQASQMMYDLKRRNYIYYGEGDSVVLTDKAKIKIIDKVIQMNRQDGKPRLVSFDIPESKRNNRDKFRLAIKRMGFRQIQKSLWACKYNVGDLVEIAAAEYKVSDYIAYFISEKSNIDTHIAKVLNKDTKKSPKVDTLIASANAPINPPI